MNPTILKDRWPGDWTIDNGGNPVLIMGDMRMTLEVVETYPAPGVRDVCYMLILKWKLPSMKGVCTEWRSLEAALDDGSGYCMMKLLSGEDDLPEDMPGWVKVSTTKALRKASDEDILKAVDLEMEASKLRRAAAAFAWRAARLEENA